MLRLLKYELRKTLFAKVVLLGVTLVAQALFLYGFWSGRDNPLTIGAVLLFFIAVTGIALMGILSLITLHRDMNTRQGYMLFMTPHSSYAILGAKVVECALSLLLAGVFFFALGTLDISMILGKDTNRQIWEMFTQLIRTVNDQIVLDTAHISALVFSLLCSWLCTITTAYLADVVSSALLNGKRANWVLTFLLFLALNYAVSKLLTLVPDTLGVVPVLLVQGAASLVLAGVMYAVTARLMDRYLSV